MPTELDIAWLAGLIDGEGCIAFARRSDYNPHRLLELRYDVKLAMACQETIEFAAELFAEIVGAHVRSYEEKRKIKRRLPLWRCEVASKHKVYTLLSALLPYMRTKRLEAQLCVMFLERSRQSKHYRANDFDRRLAEIATDLRHGRGGARAAAEEILARQVIPSEAVQGNGCTERVETSDLSPNNNDRHERPAPLNEGEDIVQSDTKVSGVGLNSQPLH